MTGTFVGTTKFAARGHGKGAGSPAPLIHLCLVDYAGISRTILPIPLPSCIRWRADGHVPIRVVRSRIAASQLVMSRGKRFESARRLSRIGISKPNIRNRGDSQRRIEGFATSSLHHGVGTATVACCEWSRGTAGGVGESSWINGQVNAPRFQTICPGQVGFGIGRGAG